MTKDQELTNNITDDRDRIKEAPLVGLMTNFGGVVQKGNKFGAMGVRDFTDPESLPIDADTLMAEGSVGKVRFAGLAYMLQQEGVIDLQTNANGFFASKEVGKFLDRKYPTQGMQQEILKFFDDNNKNATLADLLTHRAGVGDLTRDQGRMFERDGVNMSYDLPKLIKIPEDKIPDGGSSIRQIPRENGKPRAQNDPKIKDEDLPKAEYGKHEYSNLGYALMGVAMEASYDMHRHFKDKGEMDNYKPNEKPKTYQNLMNNFMLHPVEGPAKGKIEFNSTKFPEELSDAKNKAKANWIDPKSKEVIDANQFNGANAAGGMLTSTNDAVKFFGEFFKGFPETPEYGQSQNKFFTDATIDKMMAEGVKFGEPAGKHEKTGNLRYQGPGFNFEVDKESGDIIQYDKNGDTYGYGALMTFQPQESTVFMGIVASENVSVDIAKKAKVELPNLMSVYKDQENGFNRRALLDDHEKGGPGLIQEKVCAPIAKEAKIPMPLLMSAYWEQDRGFNPQAVLDDYKAGGVDSIKNKVENRSKQFDMDALSASSETQMALASIRDGTKVHPLIDGVNVPQSSLTDKAKGSFVERLQSKSSKGGHEI